MFQNNEKGLLTIVIPIYNVEKYLKQCLDSLVYQTTQNFEVILVNDGSTDRSGEIAQDYASRYGYQYIYQENAGLGAARNTGLKNVQTPYVEFLDSDDWLIPCTVENIIRTAKNENRLIDIMFMTPIVFNMATNKFEQWSDTDEVDAIFSNVHMTSPCETTAMYGLEPSVNRSVWSVEFLRKYNFSFPVGVKWEDVFPHFYLFYHARSCVYVRNAGFYYRINSGSQITSMSGEARMDIIPAFSNSLLYAFENEWNMHEIAYIIRMMESFVRWSLEMSNSVVRKKLVVKVHELVCAIPMKYMRAYYREFKLGKMIKLYYKILRSPLLYRMIANRHMQEAGFNMMMKLKKILSWRKR